MTGRHLLIIDPQNDFCDPERGSLFVPGAAEDMARLAALIDRSGDGFEAIHLTLDTHHLYDIAHPSFWRDAQGRAPAPFTSISASDVRDGRWTTADPAGGGRAIAYLEALATGGRYPHVIWPPHCLVGSWGHNVVEGLREAIARWEVRRSRAARVVFKGMNAWTEHFSAIRAEVPDAGDRATTLDEAWLATLAGAEQIMIAGEAGSHCVANTVRDLAEQLGGASRLALLTDAVSPVSGFEGYQEAFIEELTRAGMGTRTTREVGAVLG